MTLVEAVTTLKVSEDQGHSRRPMAAIPIDATEPTTSRPSRGSWYLARTYRRILEELAEVFGLPADFVSADQRTCMSDHLAPWFPDGQVPEDYPSEYI